MSYVIEEKKCTGCSACKNVCPKQCIEMKENSEGFLYPIIDEKKCIHCGLCKKTCPVLNNKKNNNIPKTVIAKNKDVNQRNTSSSGGIFEVIATHILNNNGIIYGAVLENNCVYHISVENKEELGKLKGSKYVQSDISNIMDDVKIKLQQNRLVLFSGTACQVAGLKAFLKKDYSNLYTCDVLCHGVPSPKVFKKYCEYLENMHNSKIINYEFRNKDISWQNFSTKVTFSDSSVYKKIFYDDLYMKAFLQNLDLRQCCYDCSFKCNSHISDITLGDYWGIGKYYKNFNDKKGTSVVFINTNNGAKLIEQVKKDIDYIDCDFERAIFGNEILRTSVKHNANRENFFSNLDKESLKQNIINNLPKDPMWKRVAKWLLSKVRK